MIMKNFWACHDKLRSELEESAFQSKKAAVNHLLLRKEKSGVAGAWEPKSTDHGGKNRRVSCGAISGRDFIAGPLQEGAASGGQKTGPFRKKTIKICGYPETVRKKATPHFCGVAFDRRFYMLALSIKKIHMSRYNRIYGEERSISRICIIRSILETRLLLCKYRALAASVMFILCCI